LLDGLPNLNKPNLPFTNQIQGETKENKNKIRLSIEVYESNGQIANLSLNPNPWFEMMKPQSKLN
jgi:hypothetical protein